MIPELLTVAAMLPADWEPQLVDLNTRSLSNEDLAWAFISAMLVQRDAARLAIARCTGAGQTVMAGGAALRRRARAISWICEQKRSKQR